MATQPLAAEEFTKAEAGMESFAMEVASMLLNAGQRVERTLATFTLALPATKVLRTTW